MLPPASSARFEKVCTLTPAFSQMARKIPPLSALVVYFWLALYLSSTPPPSRTGAAGSLLAGKLGWVAWPLSALSRKLLASARCSIWALWGMDSRIRSSTSRRKLLWAPWRLEEPTSSLSSIAQTGAQALSVSAEASMKPSRVVAAHSRSSMRGAMKYSPSGPIWVGAWRVTSWRSRSRMSFSSTPSSSQSRSVRVRPASGPHRGCMSIWGLYSWPLFTLRCMWMARDGITRRSRSKWTRRVSTPSAVRTSTRPATVRGRSSQEAMFMPP